MLTDFDISVLANRHINFSYLADDWDGDEGLPRCQLDSGEVFSSGLSEFVAAVIEAHEKKKETENGE